MVGITVTSRNPYFIGINSAILRIGDTLFLVTSRNPYFIGINSAIAEVEVEHTHSD